MLPDLNNLTDDQVESLVAMLARFAAWMGVRQARPDAAPFTALVVAEQCREDYEEVALDYLSTAQALTVQRYGDRFRCR